MWSFLRPVAAVAIVMAVPLVPFLLLGEAFEERVADWVRNESSSGFRLAAVTGVLAADIFLPVPSSAVSTWAGGVLGFASGVVASWLGLTLGCLLGFGLARAFGTRFVSRFSELRDRNALLKSSSHFGPLVLIMTRPLPILAEASVLLAGAIRMPWRTFVPPIVTGNLLVSVVYCGCGVISQEYDSLLPAAVISGTIPLVIALLARRWLWTANEADAADACTNEL